MAAMNTNFVKALQLLRTGEMKYGEDTGYGDLLSGYAVELGMDRKRGDPAYGQFPCRLVHDGKCDSCELFGLITWFNAFQNGVKV